MAWSEGPRQYSGPNIIQNYTNDQPTHPNTKRFIYANDTAVAAQGKSFEEVENKIN